MYIKLSLLFSLSDLSMSQNKPPFCLQQEEIC